MLKKISFFIVSLFLISASEMINSQASGIHYNTRESIGFVGEYDFKNQEKDNGLTSSEKEQIGESIPNAGDSNPMLYLLVSSLGGALIIFMTTNLIMDIHYQKGSKTKGVIEYL